jgi:hypothetical protein
MNVKVISLCFLIYFFCWGSLFAQENKIYVPPQFQKIYNGSTRSWDGKPGKDYWQNSANYYLNVELDTETNAVTGRGDITYYNNSPDTLKKIVFRLYQDIFKKGIARDYGFNEKAINEGTRIKYLSINGSELDPDTAGYRSYTNYHLNLAEQLAPSDHLDIVIEWEFEIPEDQTIRMGKYRDGGFFVAYWYPQIAVYDDVDGWDITEYLGQVEFYNDINNFEVEITVPENYLIRATGDLLNAQDVLREDIYSRYKNALVSEDVVRIIKPEDLEEDVTAEDDNQTWHYKAAGVPDFTFACVKDYLWDGVAALADAETGRKVFADVLYKEGDNNFDEGAYFSKIIVEYLSAKLPGVSFPYSHMTSFCNGTGGGGMESPMMANDGAPNSRSGTLSLLLHEIAHTYFPFYMGINERKYGWMDEGWATFLTKDLVSEIDSNYSHYKNIFRRYSPVFGKEIEVPLMIPSKLVKGYPLVAAIYGRAFFAFVALEDLLGEGLFKKALKEFIKRWKGKHPLPYDFFFTFNEVAGEDLSWFWNPWFYDLGYCDLGLEQNDDGEIVVKLIGNHPVSVDVIVTYQDGSKQFMQENPGIWKNGNTEFIIQIDDRMIIQSITINDERIPDLNPDNNYLIID